jgi:MFS family permease
MQEKEKSQPSEYQQELTTQIMPTANKPSAATETNWNNNAWTLAGIIFTLWTAIFFGILTSLFNDRSILTIFLSIVFSLFVLVLLFIIVFFFRKPILYGLRRLNKSFRINTTFDNNSDDLISEPVINERKVIISQLTTLLSIGIALASLAVIMEGWILWLSLVLSFLYFFAFLIIPLLILCCSEKVSRKIKRGTMSLKTTYISIIPIAFGLFFLGRRLFESPEKHPVLKNFIVPIVCLDLLIIIFILVNAMLDIFPGKRHK